MGAEVVFPLPFSVVILLECYRMVFESIVLASEVDKRYSLGGVYLQ